MTVLAEDNTCIICMTSHITAMTLPCRHAMFCYTCITAWLEHHNSCPSCKDDVTTAVQIITKFNANEEHKMRRTSGAATVKLAAALRAEADLLEKAAAAAPSTAEK